MKTPTLPPTRRLYYHDSYQRTFAAHVAAILESGGRPAVVLDATAFYPTSGGQPNDRGRLKGPKGECDVVDVIDRGDLVLHVVTLPDNGSLPLAVGDTVEATIDWPRRFDHMQQHTGQHVLSQCFERCLNAHTVAFHLGAEVTTIDLHTPTLDADAVRRVEDLANSIVAEDRPVLVHFAGPDEIDRFPLRKPPTRDGEIRIVEVEGFDWSACGGTHVARTGSAGPIKVRRWERRGGETRVEFLCGWRAIRDYRAKHDLVRRLAEGFSVAEGELGDAVDRLVEEARDLRVRLRDARAALDEYEAAQLVASAEPVVVDGRTVRLVTRHLVDHPPDDARRFAQRLTAFGDVVALLGVTGAKAHLIFAQTPGLPADMRILLATACPIVGGRGGGTRDLAQGGGSDPTRVDEALAAARRLLTHPEG